MSGFTDSAGQGMDANVGLFDSSTVAEWTAKNIHKFEGDSARISVTGESAGAGMLYYLTTLHDGEMVRCFPFSRRLLRRQLHLHDEMLHLVRVLYLTWC